jgi:hypothetical protein
MKTNLRRIKTPLLLTLVVIIAALFIAIARKPSQLGFAQGQSSGVSDYMYLPTVRNKWPFINVFGAEMNAFTTGSGFDLMDAAGAYWTRRNAVLWYDVQPTKNGGYDWSTQIVLEADLLAASEAGMEVILIIRGTPSWAQETAGYSCGPVKSSELDEFADFMAAVVDRYSKGPYYVTYFEIWNEPDIDTLQSPDPDAPFGCWGDKNDPFYGGREYADMLKIVVPEMRAENPDIKVVVGGLLLDCDPNNPPEGKDCTPALYLKGILAGGGKHYFDAVSFHAYDFYNWLNGYYGNPGWGTGKYLSEPNGILVPSLVPKAQYLRGLLDQYNKSAELLNTEAALLCGAEGDPPGEPGCEAEDTSPYEIQKAYFVPQIYAGALSEDLTANLWYTPKGWRNSGLIYDGENGRPAYDALLIAITYLAEANFVREIDEYNRVIGYEFSQPDGTTLWVVWTTDGALKSQTLPGPANAAWDTFGVPVGIGNGKVALGANTVYVEFP